jgi:ATP-dependent DNA ligase
MLGVRDGERTRLISRHGRDWGDRFRAVVAAVEALGARSCIIDGEVIASRKDGLADFELLRYRRRDAAVTLPGEPDPRRCNSAVRGCLAGKHPSL